MRSLTQTEFIALANIWKHQPCTAYLVRKELAASPVKHISDSAGSIYPAIERMKALSLITAKPTKTGRRPALSLRCTKKGEKSLRRWISDLEPHANFSLDPLRTKLVFLGLLNTRERREWIARAKQSLQEQMALLDSYANATNQSDGFLLAAHANARLINETRARWLASLDRLCR